MYMYLSIYLHVHVHVSIYLSTCIVPEKITYVSRATLAICTAKYCVIVGGTRAVGIRAHALFCACVIQENGCKFVANTPRIL